MLVGQVSFGQEDSKGCIDYEEALERMERNGYSIVCKALEDGAVSEYIIAGDLYDVQVGAIIIRLQALGRQKLIDIKPSSSMGYNKVTFERRPLGERIKDVYVTETDDPEGIRQASSHYLSPLRFLSARTAYIKGNDDRSALKIIALLTPKKAF